MIELREAFAIWVPPLPDDPFGPAWTQWAKPVLFATGAAASADAPPRYEDLPRSQATANVADERCVVVIDLPGADAILVGIEFAERGWRPVPLFNGCPGLNELVPTSELIAGLRTGAERLRTLLLHADAPPAFLLDARRMSKGVAPAPGRFDNRWFTFPQDFPSGNLLSARGMRSVLLVQEEIGPPSEDLAHVLKRWQDTGLSIRVTTPRSGQIESLTVQRPRRFRSLWYGLLAAAGLYANSAGGFGGIVPQPSSG